MDRATDYESVGRAFESPWARHNINGLAYSGLTHLIY
jgi:hypothetical protein